MQKFLIINQERSTDEELVYWRANGQGYTASLEDAGRYSPEDIASRDMGGQVIIAENCSGHFKNGWSRK